MAEVIVIGGGPAGMIAAGFSAAKGNNVTLIEKNDRLGKKLFITGKGRCNVTNACDPEEMLANTPGNPYFLYSAFYTFTSSQLMDFLEENGVRLKIERGNRVFPESDKSSDIIKAFLAFLNRNNVKIKLNTNVKKIMFENGKAQNVITDKGIFGADSVIVATGGLSYPVTGSTGDGYRFAQAAGHKVNPPFPSLVPLKIKESFCRDLQGLSLKNIGINVFLNSKSVYKDFGEMMFTDVGVTGPVVLSSSRYITKRLNEKCEMIIDLKPALSENELDARLLRDFEKYKNKDFKNALDDLFPRKLIPVIIKLSGINPKKKINEVTKGERKELCRLIKNIRLTVTDTTGYNEAVVTCGGVDVDEIDPSTMRSRLVENLYFAGEVIDVDGFTGGFNLQIAFSTGYVAGSNA